MADSSLPVFDAAGSLVGYLQTYENNVGGTDVHSEAVTPTDPTGVPFGSTNPQHVAMTQRADPNNTQVVTAAEAQPGNPWVGTASQTRSRGVVGIFLSVIAPAAASAIGGTYTFEFSEDGATWPISIPIHVNDFRTIRFRQLLDVGEYYRAKFEPDAPLGADFVVVTSQFATQADPAFVVPAHHQFEEEDAAFGGVWSFAQGFVEQTGKSALVRVTPRGDQFVVDRSRDTSLTGETVNSAWYPEITASFFGGVLPPSVHETANSGGVTTDLTGHQLKVTVPAGGVYVVATRQQTKYTNGQETRGLGTTVFESAPAAGHTAILWLMSRDETSGFGIGHHNGDWVFAWRFDNVTTYTTRPNWTNDDKLSTPVGTLVDANFQTPQINRLRMLYLGFGPLAAEVRNIKLREVDPWATMHVEHFINDGARLLPNLSNPNLGMALEVINTGSGDCIVRTNSWGIGPVVGDIGEQQPDGDRIFPRADGVAVDQDGVSLEYIRVTGEGGQLGTSETVTTGVVDSDGQNQLEIFIETDQVSASNGVKVYYTNNSQADVIHYSPPVAFTVTAEDVAQGFAVFPISVNMDGFKVEYTNGGFAANWRMVVTMRKPSRPLAQRMMTGEVQKTDAGVVNWSRQFGYNDAGDFKKPAVHDDGWQRMSVKAHEVPTPIKSDTSVTMSTGTVSTTGDKIVDSTVVPAGATSVCIQAANNNGNAVIYLATSQAGSVGGSAAGADLAAGQSMTYSIGQGLTTDIWGASSTGTARWRKTWLIGGGV